MEFNGIAFNETVNCNCLQNCLDSNVVMEKKRKLQNTKQYLSEQVGILMQIRSFTPYRYERQVIYTLTDFFGEMAMKFIFQTIRETRIFLFSHHFQSQWVELLVCLSDYQFSVSSRFSTISFCVSSGS